MNKKGQGLSINLIIVAAIALVVLVIVILLFAGKVSLFGERSSDCVSRGGQCVDSKTDKTGGPLDEKDQPTSNSIPDACEPADGKGIIPLVECGKDLVCCVGI